MVSWLCELDWTVVHLRWVDFMVCELQWSLARPQYLGASSNTSLGAAVKAFLDEIDI